MDMPSIKRHVSQEVGITVANETAGESTQTISVIMPVYNGERHIACCIESILTQTKEDLELICVDDGSTDSTPDILDHIAADDVRVVVIHQENRGEGAARNAGLDRARGSYLAFFDADDFVEPCLLEHAYTVAERSCADVVVYRADSYNDVTGETLPLPWSLDLHAFPNSPTSYRDNPDHLLLAFQNWTWNKLFRADFVKACGLRFHEIQRSADLFFVCCALAKAQRIATLDETLYHYRVGNPTSNIATNERAPLDFYESLLAVRDYLQRENLFDTLQKSFVNLAAGSILYNLASLKAPAAFEELRAAMQGEGCAQLGIENYPRENYLRPAEFEQIQHLMHDDADAFLFSFLRYTQCRAEEHLNDSLRVSKELDEILNSKTYRLGSGLLSPAKRLLNR